MRQYFINKLKNNKLALISYLTVSVIFLPLIFKGYFYGDDFGFIYVSKSLGHNPARFFLNQWPIIGYRPVADLLISISTSLFRGSFWAYAFLNINILFLAITVFSKSFHRHMLKSPKENIYQYVPLYFLAFFSTTVFFSAVTHIVTVASILFWALSYKYLCIYLYETNRRKDIVLSGLFIFLGLLNYEIFLPLVVIHVAQVIVYIRENKIRRSELIKRLSNTSLHIVLPFLFGYIYQKYIAVSLGATDYNRITAAGLTYKIKLLLIKIYELTAYTTYDLPRLGISSAKATLHSYVYVGLLVISTLLLTLIVVFVKHDKVSKKKVNNNLKFSFALIIGVMLASAVLLSISGMQIKSEGYSNRLLFPFWFGLCMTAVMVFNKLRGKYRFFIVLSYAVLGLAFLGVQREFVLASKLRRDIKLDVTAKVSTIPDNGIVLLANIPQCINAPIANNDVYTMAWDVDAAVKYDTRGKVSRAVNIQLQEYLYKPWMKIEPEKVTILAWWELRRDEPGPIYFYTYNRLNSTSSLVKSQNWEDVNKFISEDSIKFNHSCRNDLESFDKSSQDLNSFLSNFLR